jgi:hypothetical protein
MKTLTDPRIQAPDHGDSDPCVKGRYVVMCERCGAVVAAPPGIPIHEAWHARIDGTGAAR